VPEIFQTNSPIDGSLLFERSYATSEELDEVLQCAVLSQKKWKQIGLEQRLGKLQSFIDAVAERSDILAQELTEQMGRPIRYSAGELKGFVHRAETMLSLAPAALADIVPPEQQNSTRFIRREPLGVVLVLSPWNYPYLTAVNAIVPALAAGNVVVLKHSEQTALCAERLAEAATAAGLPDNVFQVVHCTHEQVANVVADPRVDFVAFTGSVEGGLAVQKAASERFIGVGLELGGKDPAYVRADAPLQNTVENLVDGAFFNSGQSCCGIERIYVHSSLYDDFVASFVEMVHQYELGDPRKESTTLGPMVRTSNADRVRAQIKQAIDAGAVALVTEDNFAHSKPGTPYLAPQVLVNVDHSMTIMKEESFGPVIGIMAVSSDEEAIQLMNDSEFGLTASIWTTDLQRGLELAEELETGTVFMNRCDFLDPELSWVGVKKSGRGCTLSTVGFEQMTRPKSFYLRHL